MSRPTLTAVFYGYGAITHYRPPSQLVPPSSLPRPGPRSLAATDGVSVDVLSSGYLDVSVPRVRFEPMYSVDLVRIPRRVGFPIRKSSDQSLFAAPRSLSQRTTSFIASSRQGIHQTPFSRLIASRKTTGGPFCKTPVAMSPEPSLSTGPARADPIPLDPLSEGPVSVLRLGKTGRTFRFLRFAWLAKQPGAPERVPRLSLHDVKDPAELEARQKVQTNTSFPMSPGQRPGRR